MDNKDKIGREWLDLRDVTDYASVSARTVRSWIHARVSPLPAIRVAGKTLVRRCELDAWLERHRIKPLAHIDVDAIVKEVLSQSRYGR